MSEKKTVLPGKEQSGIIAPAVVVEEVDRIEPVSQNKDLDKIAKDEAAAKAFMEEVLVVKIHGTTDRNAASHVILSVNGLTHPVVRGRTHSLKRKFVEVLARMWESSYEQQQHPTQLDQYEMKETAALAYPFDVIRDDNPRGREWLEHILAEKG